MAEYVKAGVSENAVRCYTRALKNVRHLQEVVPETFARDPSADGFGTGVPLEILRGLHRIQHDSPALNGLPTVAEAILIRRPPTVRFEARDFFGLFSGTVHFAQLTFRTSSGDFVLSTADMNQIVQYAQHAVVPISEYTGTVRNECGHRSATSTHRTIFSAATVIHLPEVWLSVTTPAPSSNPRARQTAPR